MSLFHGTGGAVTLMFANDKWTRNEEGTTVCSGGGTAHVTITAEYPLPPQLDDPIPLLTGRGTQTVAAGGDCVGGGDFQSTFERTGD
jgi:serine/threonine-protein kinase